MRLKPFQENVAAVKAGIEKFRNVDFANRSAFESEVSMLRTTLEGFPDQDEEIKADIARFLSKIEKTGTALQAPIESESIDPLLRMLPEFILHSARADQIPDYVNVSDFVSDPTGTSQGMTNLCDAVELNPSDIQELSDTDDTSHREAFEDSYTAKISGSINKFWKQKVYQVHFRFEKGRFSVSIRDNNYSVRIPPSERSDGFQWLLSFYCKLRSDQLPDNPKIVLLDNPAVDLHIDGQRDIKTFLEKDTSKTSQVIYVTHSPGMIDPYNLPQLRQVEHACQTKGTVVTGLSPKGSDLLEPVRLAVGASFKKTYAKLKIESPPATKAAPKTKPARENDGSKKKQKKRTTYYKEHLKNVHSIGFNKRRVAEVLRDHLLKEEWDKETQKNFVRI